MHDSVGRVGRRFAACLALLLTVQLASAARVESRCASSTASGHSVSAAAQLDRLLGLIDSSPVPALVGEERWYDLVALHRPVIEQARDHREFADAVNALIDATDVSHFRYYTDHDWSYWHLRSVFGARRPDAHIDHIGLFPQRIEGRWFVRGVLEGSPACETPIRVGDELLTVDGSPFEPVDSFRSKAGQPVRLMIRRKPQLRFEFTVTPVRESLHRAVQRAMQKSVRVIEHQGLRFAYLHAWTLLGHGDEYERLLELQDEVDGLLLDYRDGFGGNWYAATQFFLGSDNGYPRSHQDYWRKPAVILIADGTRSAKEIVVDAVKRRKRAVLLGTPTPGHVTAVGGLRRVGPRGLVMLPGQQFGLEGNPTEPHIYMARDIRYSAGADPQLAYAKRLLGRLIR
jgi:carboxyl-terminal processing protease